MQRIALLAALALMGCGTAPGTMPGGDGGGGAPDGAPDPASDGGGVTGAFRAVELFDLDERVTGIYCTSARACVVSTDPPGAAGHVYATDGTSITRTLVTGDSDFAMMLGTIGTVSFLGFSHADGRLIARVDGQEAAFVTATGDPTQVSSWSAVRLGTASGAGFGLNSQFGFAANGGRWLLASKGRIFESTDSPSPSALWTNIWSPQATPPIPADIDAQRDADPTICNTDPSVGVSPDLVQPTYVASDLSLVISPSGTVNQGGDDTPGVCISTNGGRLFRHVEFPDIEMGSGPLGVTCTSADHCVAYGGLEFRPGSVFVFVTTDASAGAASTWTRATLPSLVADTRLRHAFFAPGGTRGWIVGAAGAGAPLLLATVDGGAAWSDETSMVRGLAPDVRLHSGYAFDATHIWIGGEHDVLLTTGD